MTNLINLSIKDEDFSCKVLQDVSLFGIGQLSRVRLLIKQGSPQSLIDKHLKAAAEEEGLTVNEIEDMTVDDFRMTNGIRCFHLDEFKAYLVITGTGKTEIKWVKPNGSLQKSVPTVVKEKYGLRLKKIKDTAKRVEQTLISQRDRIDRMFEDNRKIPWNNFKQYYLDHGLMNQLSQDIIWNFYKPDKHISAIFLNHCWVNSKNEIVNVSDTKTVSLWNPTKSTGEEIKAWREFLTIHQLQQPLKQAFREA
jgi:hypothetical protein